MGCHGMYIWHRVFECLRKRVIVPKVPSENPLEEGDQKDRYSWDEFASRGAMAGVDQV